MWVLIPRCYRSSGIFPWLVPSVLLFHVLIFLVDPLRTATAPWGILSLQLAGTGQRASAVIASWDEEQRRLRPELRFVQVVFADVDPARFLRRAARGNREQ